MTDHKRDEHGMITLQPGEVYEGPWVPISLVYQRGVSWHRCHCGMQHAGYGDRAARADWKAEQHARRCHKAQDA